MIESEKFEVFELREVDGDNYVGVLGYFAEGHVDKQAFAIAANQEFDLASMGNGVIAVSDVQHLWYAKERDDDDCLEYFVYSKTEREGYLPITEAR